MFQLEERFHFRMEVAVATGATLVIKDDCVSNTLRRTSSFSNALKFLANGIAFPSSDDGRTPPTNSTHVHLQPEVAAISRPPPPTLNVAQYSLPYSHPLIHKEVTMITTIKLSMPPPRNLVKPTLYYV
ncbi:uncharacterized protein LACBIDRAFT_301554 [Laccaria bicolor S238N-H82]|uniref:Predicted protein n=1 Tax=Laccaria bicolor (strain S238N-H82 / ATCC MYA-4686) TaxID=486041 RepID=B0CNT5_LACBS|nr:uncharacterized protein LACBIDRAFT_301554 [Laccaria bicolor S238N-H82]EDR15995.1 predicted protein [Laccaria bicolor S238N-H82]|eukprot:XP_001874203.1 predicted protein [Laccaria bicolor S238N-H82]